MKSPRSPLPPRLGRWASALLLFPAVAPAFVYLGGVWPNGDIPVEVRMDRSGAPTLPSASLLDGTTTWDASVLAAIADWNVVLATGRNRLMPVHPSTAEIGPNNDFSNLAFTGDIYGEPFGSRTLAVTLFGSAGLGLRRYVESDILFNFNRSWNAYRGNSRSDFADLKRVALHELGHLLGLDHPDEASPVQAGPAMMFSQIGDLDALQVDDIAGVKSLYDPAVTAPVITRDLRTQSVNVGGRAEFTFELNGVTPAPVGPLLDYSWFFQPTGGELEFLFTIHRPDLILGAAQLDDAGTYSVVVENPAGFVLSEVVPLDVAPIPTSPETRLGNIATRGVVGLGDRTMIVGFVLAGDQPRQLLIRAAGPALTGAPFNVPGTLPNPRLSIVRAGGETVATNDDWQTPVGANAASAATLAATFGRLGAFAFPPGSGDAAVLVTLPPGNYSAVVDGGTDTGVAIVEVYDAETGGNSRLINLSTRGPVGVGADILIAGFNVTGPAARTYLIRVVGDTLKDFGLADTLNDPVLTLFDGAGTYLREIDDWDSPEFLQPKLRTAMASLGAFALTDRQESVMLLTLKPGSYTLQVSGFEGQQGLVLTEVYEVPL